MSCTIILSRKKKQLARTEEMYRQAAFRQKRPCVDQIATQRIIIVNTTEWQTPLYLKMLIYSNKNCDSIDHQDIP